MSGGVWIRRERCADGKSNVVWVELGGGRLLTIFEDGSHGLADGPGNRLILEILEWNTRSARVWERIA